MNGDVIIKVIEDELERMYGKDSVILLSRPETTDFERGKVAGGIVALQRVLSEIAGKDAKGK